MHTPITRHDQPPTPRSDLLLSIEIDAMSATVSVRVAGELDFAGGRRLTEATAPFLDGAPAVVGLDLAAISFADSSGAMALVELSGRIRRSGGTLEVVRSSRAIVRIFDILAATAMFQPAS